MCVCLKYAGLEVDLNVGHVVPSCMLLTEVPSYGSGGSICTYTCMYMHLHTCSLVLKLAGIHISYIKRFNRDKDAHGRFQKLV